MRKVYRVDKLLSRCPPEIREYTIAKTTPSGGWRTEKGELIAPRYHDQYGDSPQEAWAIFIRKQETYTRRMQESAQLAQDTLDYCRREFARLPVEAVKDA